MPQGHRVRAEGHLAGRGCGGVLPYPSSWGRSWAWPHFFLQLLTVRGAQVGVTLGADHLVTAVLLGQLAEGGLDGATPLTTHHVQSGLFLHVIVWECVAILQPFPPPPPPKSDAAGQVGCPPGLGLQLRPSQWCPLAHPQGWRSCHSGSSPRSASPHLLGRLLHLLLIEKEEQCGFCLSIIPP